MNIVIWPLKGDFDLENNWSLGQEGDMLKLERVPEGKSNSIKETRDHSDSGSKRNLFLLVAVMEPSLAWKEIYTSKHEWYSDCSQYHVRRQWGVNWHNLLDKDTDNSIIRPKTEIGRTRKRKSLYDIYLCSCESISILEIMNEK